MELDHIARYVIVSFPIMAGHRDVVVTTAQFAQAAFIALAFVQQEARLYLVPAPLDGRGFFCASLVASKSPGISLIWFRTERISAISPFPNCARCCLLRFG